MDVFRNCGDTGDAGAMAAGTVVLTEVLIPVVAVVVLLARLLPNYSSGCVLDP